MGVPPPPPPPPTSSARYMLTIQKGIPLSSLGIHLEPFLSSLHSPGRSIGAKIQSVDSRRELNQRNNIQVGDVLYKINHKLVKGKSFNGIQSMFHDYNIQEVPIALIFERRKERSQQSFSSSPRTPQLTREAPEIQHSVKRGGRTLEFASPINLSREGNVLHSIFSNGRKGQEDDNSSSSVSDCPNDSQSFGTNKSNKSMLSSSFYSKRSSLVSSCPELGEDDLSAIPEGAESDISRESSIKFREHWEVMNLQSTSSLAERRRRHSIVSDYISESSSPIGASFSYSASQSPPSECPSSPIGAKFSSVFSTKASSTHFGRESSSSLMQSSSLDFLSPLAKATSISGFENRPEEHAKIQTLIDPMDESQSASTVFMSPFSTLPPEATTTTPAMKSSHSTSMNYNEIPVSMLDYNYVRECSSIQELNQIIHALSVNKEFPSLLRLAQMRLGDLNDKEVEETKGGGDKGSSHIKVEEQQRFDPGIPSHIEVEIQTSVIGSSCSYQGYGADKELEQDMDQIVLAHAELQEEIKEVLKERDRIQINLTDQVGVLEGKIEELELNQVKLKDDSEGKIQALEESRQLAQEQVDDLKETVVTSSREARLVVGELKNRENDIDKLRQELELERESKRIEMEKANNIQSELRSQVAYISRQLGLHEKETKATQELIEIEIKAQLESLTENDRNRIRELEATLRESQTELIHLRNENSAMAEKLKLAEEVSISVTSNIDAS